MRADAVQDIGKISDGQADRNLVRFFHIEGIDNSLSPYFVSLLCFRAGKFYIGWIQKSIKSVLSFLGGRELSPIGRITVHHRHGSLSRVKQMFKLD